MFDETSAMQWKRQMDILVGFWDEDTHKVVIKYLISFFFERATAADIVQKIMAYQEKRKLPFERLYNKAIWSGLNATLKEMGHQGLISFCSSSLHIVHNAFKKYIEALEGKRASELAFDLRNWFKRVK